jgi:hypothetical protein
MTTHAHKLVSGESRQARVPRRAGDVGHVMPRQSSMPRDGNKFEDS